MKIVGVGDPVIPEDAMEKIFRGRSRLKAIFGKVSWGISDLAQLQRLRSVYEARGPGAVPAPKHIIEQAADAQILVVHFTPLSEEIFSGLSELKVVGTARAGVENIDIKELFKESDFISLHARLSVESHHLVNAELLVAMKPYLQQRPLANQYRDESYVPA